MLKFGKVLSNWVMRGAGENFFYLQKMCENKNLYRGHFGLVGEFTNKCESKKWEGGN